MIGSSRTGILLVCLAVFFLASCDEVWVQNVSGELGLLIDAEQGGQALNDRGFTAQGVGDVQVDVGALSGSPNRNEAIGFGRDRAPARVSTAWTDLRDSFALPLGDPIHIPLSVWIVQGPFSGQAQRVVDSCFRTSTIWDAERMGVRLSEVVIRDATADPDITDAILNSIGEGFRNWDDYSNHIGFDPGRINIYWINTVEGRTTWGWSDFGARIVMGKDTSDHLLAHEIGHAFRLFHPAACGAVISEFDKANVMWECSGVRAYLAEGQIFRAHFNSASGLNALYQARPGLATAPCDGHAQTEECPAVDRRLWPDGAFAAQVP